MYYRTSDRELYLRFIELEIIVIESNNAGYWNSFYKGVLLSITEVTPGKTRTDTIQFYYYAPTSTWRFYSV